MMKEEVDLHTDESDQIEQWLKKLERESWQLELLVSAFTIFLLIQAIGAYSGFLTNVQYSYNLNNTILIFIYLFLSLLGTSIKALTAFLILHLMLRGFWIGAIGLRSVQSSVDFRKLNYSDLFTERLRKKVVSLDNLVVMLDEICSLMFSFAFLIMSIFISFGMFILFFGITAISFGGLSNLTTGIFSTIISIIGAISVLGILITGLIYFVDYFTLGFFKKLKWFSKLYYPFYRFYGTVTLAAISRSIYYYLISKFSKRRIRIMYAVAGVVILFTSISEYDQYQFYPNTRDNNHLYANYYDNMRPEDKYISRASIQSNMISGDFLQLFIVYDPEDNQLIQTNCPEFKPAKQDGFNWTYKFEPRGGGFNLTRQDFSDEDRAELLDCLSSSFRTIVNDSVYSDLKFYYFEHPSKSQKGLITLLSSNEFNKGENILEIKRVSRNEDGEEEMTDHAYIPFWFE